MKLGCNENLAPKKTFSLATGPGFRRKRQGLDVSQKNDRYAPRSGNQKQILFIAMNFRDRPK
jgi:hypothetical protein